MKVEKAIPEHLKHLLHTVNYKKTPEWDKEVLKIYPDGADFVIEVGGAGTLERAFRAVKHGGVVADIGFVAQGGDIPNVPLMTILTGAIYVSFRDILKDSRHIVARKMSMKLQLLSRFTIQYSLAAWNSGRFS